MSEIEEMRAICDKLDDIAMSPEGWNLVDLIRCALLRLESRESKKTVPMAMLNNAYSVGMDYGRGLADCDRNALRDIAARYGYEVTE